MHNNSLPTTSESAIERKWHTSLDMSYLQAGDRGPVIILLHGWGAFKELWWSTILALAPHYRVFALDFPGHNDSPMREVDSMSGLATMVAQFCADLDLHQITVVGHSMGGSVSTELALRHPALVRRLVLVDAAVDARDLPFYVRTYLHSTLGWSLLRMTMRLGQLFAPLGRRVPHLHGGGILRPWMRRSSYLASYNPDAIRRILHGLFSAHAGERLAQISVPTLVVSGLIDTLVPVWHSQRTAKRIPNAAFTVISGASHNPMDERPREFETALLGFFRQTDEGL